MAITFFNPTVPSGLINSEQWDVQSSNPSTSYERAASLGADGDETASELYGERETITVSCTCKANASTVLDIPAVGTIAGGYHIDSVTLNCSAAEFPTLEVSAHKHGINTSHEGTGAKHRTYSIPDAIASTLKGGLGVPAGAAGLTLADLAAGFTSLSITLTANHVEAPYVGAPPAIPASDNHDGSITVTAEIVGQATPTIAEGIAYDKTESSVTNGNTTDDSTSITYVMHLKHD